MSHLLPVPAQPIIDTSLCVLEGKFVLIFVMNPSDAGHQDSNPSDSDRSPNWS